MIQKSIGSVTVTSKIEIDTANGWHVVYQDGNFVASTDRELDIASLVETLLRVAKSK